MSQYSGNIRDLPVVTSGHFIENSTIKIVFGPEGRFWDDYVMRLFTPNVSGRLLILLIQKPT